MRSTWRQSPGSASRESTIHFLRPGLYLIFHLRFGLAKNLQMETWCGRKTRGPRSRIALGGGGGL